MWEFVKNMKKYVALGIRRAKRNASRRIYLFPYNIKTLGHGEIPSFLLYRLCDLEKFRAPPQVPV